MDPYDTQKKSMRAEHKCAVEHYWKFRVRDVCGKVAYGFNNFLTVVVYYTVLWLEGGVEQWWRVCKSEK
jgi:hypothetical protein